MLELLAKKDSKWRQVAYSFCGNKQLADEIVQEMYLRRYDNNRGQPVKDDYIIMTIRSVFLNMIRKKRFTISIDKLHYIESHTNDYELTDEDLEILKKYDKQDWKDKELILESYDKSLRQIAKEFPMVNYGYAFRRIIKAIKNILGEDYHKYKNRKNRKESNNYK